MNLNKSVKQIFTFPMSIVADTTAMKNWWCLKKLCWYYCIGYVILKLCGFHSYMIVNASQEDGDIHKTVNL